MNKSYNNEKNNLMDEDISDKEFKERYLPFYDNYNEYMVNFVIPDALAYLYSK